jgi:hypothetical protein
MLGVGTNFSYFESSAYPGLGVLVLTVFSFITTIIMLNILIAILGQRFESISAGVKNGIKEEICKLMLDQCPVMRT